MFHDRINYNTPYRYSNQVIDATNPCVPGYVRLHTSKGMVKMEDLYRSQEPLTVTVDTRAFGMDKGTDARSAVPVFMTDPNADVYRITTKHGYTIDATDWHELYTTDGKKEVKDLKVGDVLLVQSDIGLFGEQEYPSLAELSGKNGCQVVPEFVWRGTQNTVAAYLRGLFDTYAEVYETCIILTCDSADGVADIQTLLANFGILSYRTGGTLGISGQSVRRFAEFIGFRTPAKIKALDMAQVVSEPQRFESEIVSIEYLGKMPVYDTTQDDHNTIIFNGLVSGNCGEEPLPPDGSCNLGSLNLTKFVKDGQFDFHELRLASIYGTVFLDLVIDANHYPTDGIDRWAKENRAIGLGIFGYADTLLALGMKYGSEEANEFLKRVLGTIYYAALETSESLGKDLGIPEKCQYLPEPRRNITLLTIAPTGTLSLLSGHDLFGAPQPSSSGIEPVFSDSLTRKDNTGTYQIEHPLAHAEHFSCAVPSGDASTVTVHEHLATLNTASGIIDSGVSKTINLPHDFTVQEVYDTIVLVATRYKNIKGLTFYRSGSRNEEVLSPTSSEKKSDGLVLDLPVTDSFTPTTKAEWTYCPECGAELQHSDCVICPECGWGLCA